MLLSNLDVLATAPGGVARLRELILTLAVQGKLVPQDPADEPASELLKQIQVEKDRLIAAGIIKRDKPVAEISEEEKPFELPDGWEWARLGRLANFIDYRGKTPTKTETGIPLITAKNVRQGFINRHPREFIAETAYADWMTRGLPKVGDLLFTTEAPLGNVAAIDIQERFALAQRVICFGLYESKMSGALATFLRSPWMQSVFAEQATGVTAQGIKSARLQVIPVPLPPLAEQFRIATRVEELMRLCDALEAKSQLEATQHAQLVSTLLGQLTASSTPAELHDNWQRVVQHFDLLLDRPAAVDALEQTILQLAVRGLLVPQDPTDEPASALLQKIRLEKDRLIAEGKIKRDKPLAPIAEDEKPFGLPVGWEWMRVSDVVEMLNGYAFKSEWFKGSGVRLLRNLNVSHGFVDWSQPVAIDTELAVEYEQFALEADDIVLSLDRPIISTGLKYAVIREVDLPCLLLQRVARLAPNASIVSSEFLVLWLQSDLFVATIDPGRSNGVPHISTKQVSGLAFPLPPLEEQSRIVTRVESLRRLCADLRQRLAARQTTQAHLAEVLVNEVA